MKFTLEVNHEDGRVWLKVEDGDDVVHVFNGDAVKDFTQSYGITEHVAEVDMTKRV